MNNSLFLRAVGIFTVMVFFMACSIPAFRPSRTKTSVSQTVTPLITVVANTLVPTKVSTVGVAASPTPIRMVTEPKPPTQVPATEIPKGSSNEFPMPKDAKNVITMPDTMIFQTNMSLKDAMAFYREAFTRQGLKERPILTVTSDKMFSMVFDGAKDGKSVIVQGVDLGGGLINITLRYEKV